MHRVLRGAPRAQGQGGVPGQPRDSAVEANALNRLTRRINVVDPAKLGVIDASLIEDQEVVGRGWNIGEERIVPLQGEEVTAGGSEDRKGDRDICRSAKIMKAAGRQVGIDIAENEIAREFRSCVGI